jgi:catechol 2,3-dioxygenase-like lactoylglutathione lyase family enzyme
MIRRIHHVQIIIPPGMEQEARSFYCGILGLREVEKPTALKERGGLWLALGDQQIHIGTEEHVDRNLTKAHIAYQVENLRECQDRLEQTGIIIGDSVPIPGWNRFEFRDPFGNRVELLESAPQESGTH